MSACDSVLFILGKMSAWFLAGNCLIRLPVRVDIIYYDDDLWPVVTVSDDNA